jgi:aminopeptidase C
MKKMLMCGALLAMGATAMAQETAQTDSVKPEGFIFTTVDSVAITPVKNQKNAGTCWSYSTIGFLESEALRKTGKVYDFSEMFIVYNTYMDRADKAIRMHGDASFSQGGSFYDVVYAMKHYGLVPDSEMPAGVMYGDTLSNHDELSAVTEPLVAAIAKGDLRSLQFSPDGTPLWRKALAGIYDTYLGKLPESFTYEGKKYTPKTFAESTGLKAEDYVSITSFMHHPYSEGEHIGEGFVIEVQDNWRWGVSYNFELDDMMAVFDNAIKEGYTIAWGADVSEDGFTRDGLAVYPDVEAAPEQLGSDQARWLKLSRSEKRAELTKEPLKQKVCTPEERQRAYDNYETTDDHGMLIFGTAKDQQGNPYYMVKNSWGKTGKYNGIWYATPEFCRYKTMNILVNKNAVPKALRKKYGIDK